MNKNRLIILLIIVAISNLVIGIIDKSSLNYYAAATFVFVAFAFYFSDRKSTKK